MPVARTAYERLGGERFFEELTRRFYAAVPGDPLLARLYPRDEAGLEDARLRLRDFLIEHFGGPPLYRQRRGEPRLTRRHARFAIGQAERDAWVAHMREALEASDARDLELAQLQGFFEATATSLINRDTYGSGDGDQPSGAAPTQRGSA
jgi:hemoglobin